MKAGKYTLRELFGNNHLSQILIPEIQRDYVWSEEQVITLLSSLIGYSNGTKEDSEGFEKFKDFKKFEITIGSVNTDVINSFNEYYKYFECATNIGFIYAYNDEQYVGKYFLIDGQQRLTTIYLILLALVDKDTINDFKKYGLFKEYPKIDFKVRESAHTFFNKFINYIIQENNIDDIEQQNWFYFNYQEDTTIQSIIKNYRAIKLQVEVSNLDKRAFFDYLLDYVEFWYFDTSKSEQGEELYIFMNARGEQMQMNENIKADLLGKLNLNESWVSPIFEREDYTDYCKQENDNLTNFKNYWGRKWEEWQDFFWMHREKNDSSNADKGFNEFLRWVYLIESVGNAVNIKIEDLKALFDLTKFDFSSLSIYKIEKYFKAVELLFLSQRTYVNNSWIAGINTKDEDDDKDVKTKGSSLISKLVLFRLLPVIYYVKEFSNYSEKDLQRVIRFFYNLSRKKSTIGKSPDVSCVRAIQTLMMLKENEDSDISALAKIKSGDISGTILNKEELFKLEYYKSLDEEQRLIVEESFATLEDHTSSEGEIYHFIQLSQKYQDEPSQSLNDIMIKDFNFDYFMKIKTAFFELLPLKISGNDYLWGHLLLTPAFIEVGDRIKWNGSNNNFRLVRDSKFLDWVLNIAQLDLKRAVFFKNLEETFLKSYDNTSKLIITESDAKRQLYIYYLIRKNTEKWYWDWDEYANFRFLENDRRSEATYLFDKKFSFQIYKGSVSDALDKLINQNIQLSDLDKLICSQFPSLELIAFRE